MGQFFDRLLGIRQQERGLALLMAAYHFVLLLTLYLLKPVRDSVFLSERGAAELPFVFILTTLVLIPVAGLHAHASRRFSLGRMIDGVTLVLAACLIGLRELIAFDGTWVTYALYVWVSIYAVLVTSQFWLLANAVFNAAQSKRVFPMLSLGAILGAIAGGEITNGLVESGLLQGRNLLWVAAALLAASVGLVALIRYRWRVRFGEEDRTLECTEEDPTSGIRGAWDALRGSRHLWLIIGLTTLTIVTTTFVDFQFKTVASQAYVVEEELTSFMGRFYGRVSIVALIVQFLIAPRLIRMLGIGGALGLLPLGLSLGAIGMIAVPGLAAGIAMRGTEQSLKHSIDKTGRELLFVPVDLETKKRIKVFIDLFVSKGSQGIGGLLLLLFTLGLGFDVQQLSAVVLLLLGGWGVIAYRARRSYTDQFRRQLRQQENFEVESDAEEHDEPQIPTELEELLKSLCNRGEREAKRALNELEEGEKTVPIDAMRCLLDHNTPEIRAHVIRVLRKRKVKGLGEAVAEYLTDPDPNVQLEAARYMFCDVTGDRCRRLERGLQHDDPRIQAATVGLIAEDGAKRERELISEDLLRRLIRRETPGAEERRVQVARVLGALDTPYRNELLLRLLRDSRPAVVRQAIDSAGKTRDRTFILPLLDRLKETTFEEEARQALAAYGRRILGTLYDHLVDPHVDLRIRCRIPAILTLQPCQEAVEVLQLAIGQVPVPVRHAVIKALSKLHAAAVEVSFDADTIERAIRTDAERYAALGQVLYQQRKSNAPTARDLPRDRVETFREESLERVFRLLGLQFDQRDIYNAYRGITSEKAGLRSSAVEFVDNLVDWKTSRFLLPLLDDPDGKQAMRNGSEVLEEEISRWDEALDYLRSDEDPRLQALVREHIDAPGGPVATGDRAAVSAEEVSAITP